MALSTGNIGPEKSGQRIGKAIQRHTRIAQEIRRGAILSERAFGRKHVVNQFVPGTIFPKLFLQPCVKGPGLTDPVVIIFYPKHVRQPVEHVRLMTGRLQQFIDQLGPAVLTDVSLETLEFLIRRDSTHHIQINAADELNIAGWWIWFLSVFL